MRVFYAVTFSDETKEKMSELIKLIDKNSTKGRFTEKENIHLTLKFIGDIKFSEIKKLKDALSEIAIPSLELKVSGLGAFTGRDGKIVWVGLEDNKTLSDIHIQLAEILESRGYNTDKRKYTPHITLGRQVSMTEKPEKIKIDIFAFKPYSIALMESKHVDNKLVYEPVEEKLI